MHLTFVKFDSAFTLNKVLTYKNLIRWMIYINHPSKKRKVTKYSSKKDGSLHVLLNWLKIIISWTGLFEEKRKVTQYSSKKEKERILDSNPPPTGIPKIKKAKRRCLNIW